jgi:hypothetical protein
MCRTEMYDGSSAVNAYSPKGCRECFAMDLQQIQSSTIRNEKGACCRTAVQCAGSISSSSGRVYC